MRLTSKKRPRGEHTAMDTSTFTYVSNLLDMFSAAGIKNTLHKMSIILRLNANESTKVSRNARPFLARTLSFHVCSVFDKLLIFHFYCPHHPLSFSLLSAPPLFLTLSLCLSSPFSRFFSRRFVVGNFARTRWSH